MLWLSKKYKRRYFYRALSCRKTSCEYFCFSDRIRHFKSESNKNYIIINSLGVVTLLHKLNIATKVKCEIVDITDRLQELVAEEKVTEGILYIHCPHTTAAVTINENYDPTVKDDLLTHLDKLVPFALADYTHLEGNTDAHIKAVLVGPTQQIFISQGKLVLGTWQGVYFCEFDGARNRELIVKIV